MYYVWGFFGRGGVLLFKVILWLYVAQFVVVLYVFNCCILEKSS